MKLIVLRYTPGFGSRQGYIPDLQSPPDPKSDRRKYHDLAASMTDKGGVVGVEIEPPVEEHAVSALPIAVGVLIGAFVVGGVAIALFRARLRTRGGGPA